MVVTDRCGEGEAAGGGVGVVAGGGLGAPYQVGENGSRHLRVSRVGRVGVDRAPRHRDRTARNVNLTDNSTTALM